MNFVKRIILVSAVCCVATVKSSGLRATAQNPAPISDFNEFKNRFIVLAQTIQEAAATSRLMNHFNEQIPPALVAILQNFTNKRNFWLDMTFNNECQLVAKVYSDCVNTLDAYVNKGDKSIRLPDDLYKIVDTFNTQNPEAFGLTRQEIDLIRDQIDAVAESMKMMERTTSLVDTSLLVKTVVAGLNRIDALPENVREAHAEEVALMREIANKLQLALLSGDESSDISESLNKLNSIDVPPTSDAHTSSTDTTDIIAGSEELIAQGRKHYDLRKEFKNGFTKKLQNTQTLLTTQFNKHRQHEQFRKLIGESLQLVNSQLDGVSTELASYEKISGQFIKLHQSGDISTDIMNDWKSVAKATLEIVKELAKLHAANASLESVKDTVRDYVSKFVQDPIKAEEFMQIVDNNFQI